MKRQVRPGHTSGRVIPRGISPSSMMSELKFCLGLQIKKTKEGTFVSKTKYTKDLFKKFNMQESKGMKTPMPASGHLDLTKDGKPVDQKVYRSMFGSLLYLCASRPILC